MESNPGSAASTGRILPSTAVPPKTDQELAERALFFATALGMECTRTIRQYIMHCEEGADTNNKNAASQLTKDEFAEAVKEILCLSIWLTLYEHAEPTEDAPEWFKTLLLDAFGFSDRLYPTPQAKDMMGKYNLGQGIETACEMASMNICHKLKLGNTSPDASLHLAKMLMEDESKRAELLKIALTDPLADLDTRIQLTI
ncbi:MAG TPA: hypothetical protein V6D17_13860 [Candidatus Obscuribacterales bacterium]